MRRLRLLSLVFPLLGAASAVAADRLVVAPQSVSLSSVDQSERLLVSRLLGDGSRRDLTESVRYVSLDPNVVLVDALGVVRPVAPGSTAIRVESDLETKTIPVSVAKFGPAPPSSFRRDVAAVLSKAACNSGPCHGNINGKGGFRLSLRAEDASFDYRALTRELFARRVSVADPSASLVLAKPAGLVPHEGGIRFPVGSVEYETLRRWIAEGATDDGPAAPSVVKLQVEPSEALLAAPQVSQRLKVTAEFSDGSKRDVTRAATYDVSDPTAASVSIDGKVTVKGPLETVVAVRYLNGRGVSRLAFLHDRPGFVWKGPEPINVVDRLVFAKLKALKIQPAEVSTDAVFIRRAYLDATGTIPNSAQVRAFLADPAPDKRIKLVRRLVERPEFADFWALKWADLLRNEEKSMGDKGVWIFQRWLRDQIAADVPLDRFARALVAGKGSTYSNPPAGFYRTNRDPETAAEAVGQVFLGIRLQCARCHNHPFDAWTQNDYYGFAAYFANIDRKIVDPSRKDMLDKHEINGDVVVYLTGKPEMIQPRSGEMMSPKPPGGPAPRLGANPDGLDHLANWITRDNPQFARNMANRVWFHLMGRGLVEPVDDFRETNPPTNPPLLDALTREFVAGGLRLKPLVVLIMSSQAYGLGSEPNETNAEDELNYSRSLVKLPPAEVLLDAIASALGAQREDSQGPRGVRAAQSPFINKTDPFLREFGKPDRLLTCECERSNDTTLAQAFQMINGESVRRLLERSDNRLGKLLGSGRSDDAILEELYVSILGRRPNATESAGILKYVQAGKDRRRAWEDAAWALINSKEFLLRH